MLVIPHHRSTEPLKTLQLLVLEPKITEYRKTNKQKNPLQNRQIRRRLCRTSSQQLHVLPSSYATAGSHRSGSKTPAMFHSVLLCTFFLFKSVNDQEIWGNLRYLLFRSTNFLQHITNKQRCSEYSNSLQCCWGGTGRVFSYFHHRLQIL